MSDILLTLGGVACQNFEIPPSIRFGGAQRLAVHELPGGGRVIDSLGGQNEQISWDGIFSGPDASDRARLFDLARATGAVLPLIWDAFYYSVVISSFIAEYASPWWIPYKMVCAVLRDEASAVAGFAPPLGDMIGGDLTSAAQVSPGLNLAGPLGALAAANATAPGSAAYTAAVEQLRSSQAAIAGQIATASTTLEGIGGPRTPLGSGSAAQAAANVNAAVAASGQLASLTTAQGYVSRALANLTNAAL